MTQYSIFSLFYFLLLFLYYRQFDGSHTNRRLNTRRENEMTTNSARTSADQQQQNNACIHSIRVRAFVHRHRIFYIFHRRHCVVVTEWKRILVYSLGTFFFPFHFVILQLLRFTFGRTIQLIFSMEQQRRHEEHDKSQQRNYQTYRTHVYLLCCHAIIVTFDFNRAFWFLCRSCSCLPISRRFCVCVSLCICARQFIVPHLNVFAVPGYGFPSICRHITTRSHVHAHLAHSEICQPRMVYDTSSEIERESIARINRWSLRSLSLTDFVVWSCMCSAKREHSYNMKFVYKLANTNEELIFLFIRPRQTSRHGTSSAQFTNISSPCFDSDVFLALACRINVLYIWIRSEDEYFRGKHFHVYLFLDLI